MRLFARIAVVYDEIRRRNWSERANGNSPVDLEAEAAEVDKGLLMEAESKYDSIEARLLALALSFFVCIALCVTGQPDPVSAKGSWCLL